MHRIAKATSNKSFARTAKGEEGVVLKLLGKDYLFSQASIVSSIMTENESHLVKPETARYINANGDGWTNESLYANYQTFIGAYNFVNHVQDPKRAVGFIADAVLRRMLLDREQNIYIYYVDLLIATSKAKSPELIKKILTDRIEFLSMGCESFISTCSACGAQAEDETSFCDHLLNMKGKFFIDNYGRKRIVAELLGDTNPGSCMFIEASWLTEPPAFGGAAKRNILPVKDDDEVTINLPRFAMERPAIQQFVGNLRRT